MGQPSRFSPAAEAIDKERARVDAAVRFINDCTVRAGTALAREVGEYILATFFEGDWDVFGDTRRNKPLSFRRLLERDDLLLPSATIYTLVRVARQLRELPPGTGERLSLSHHRALLPVRDTRQKVAIAQRALVEHWSKTQLERFIRTQQPPSSRGRRRMPTYLKVTDRISSALEIAFSEDGASDELRTVNHDRLKGALDQIEHSLVRLQWLRATVEEALGR